MSENAIANSAPTNRAVDRSCEPVAKNMLLPRLRAYQAVLIGGFCLATIDLIFARLYWDAEGLTVQRLLQTIAAGVFGKASRDGGAVTALLGAVFHYFIATCMVWAYYLVTRRVDVLLRRPFSVGLAYGVFLYFFMNLVVLPLSAAGMPSFTDRPWVALSILMHAAFGVICSLSASCALSHKRTVGTIIEHS